MMAFERPTACGHVTAVLRSLALMVQQVLRYCQDFVIEGSWRTKGQDGLMSDDVVLFPNGNEEHLHCSGFTDQDKHMFSECRVVKQVSLQQWRNKSGAVMQKGKHHQMLE